MSLRRMMLFTLGAKIKGLIQAFKTRVLGDGGLFEAESCLETQLNTLNNEGLLDSASLVITPNGYEENVLYSVIPSKVGTNLLLRSEEFDNSYWTKLGSYTLTPNSTTAPDGTLTAELFTKTGAINTVVSIFRGSLFSTTGTYTLSFYCKQNVGDLVLFRLDAGGNTCNAQFNFTTKTFTNTGANVISTSYEELPNGWFRLILVGNVLSTTWNIDIANLFSNPTNDSVYVWGAQLVPGSTVTDYIPTTDRAIINGTIGDLTFTRATTATRVNDNYLVEFVPYNIFSRSEEFENSYWTKQGTSVTSNSIEAPDGTMTADSIIGTSGRTYSYIGGVATNIVSNALTSRNEVTVSFYLKYKGLNRIRVMYGNSTNINTYRYITVDLENGSHIDNSLDITNPFIESVGEGWYRVGFSSIMNVGTTNNRFAVGLGDTTKPIADGVDGVYMWGAQLVDGDQAKGYFRVTNGFNIPRIDYSNGGCPSILIEPQRTNIAINNNVSIGQGTDFTTYIFNPNELGQGVGAGYYEHAAGLSGQLSGFNINSIAPSLTGFTTRYVSCIIKNPSSRYMRFALTSGGVIFWVDFQTLTTSSTESTIQNIGIDTYLVIGIAKDRTDTVSNFRAALVPSMVSTTTVAGNFILGGLMIFNGNTPFSLSPSSLILTQNASVTRNADVITNTNASTLIGQTEGTIFVDYNKVLMNDTTRNIISISDTTAINAIEIWDGVGSGNLGRIIYTYFANNIVKASGLGQGSVSPSGRYKICVTYTISPALVNFKIFINGVKLDDRNFTYTAFSNPLSRVNIGNRNGIGVGSGSHNLDFISKIRITDTQAINLTTL